MEQQINTAVPEQGDIILQTIGVNRVFQNGVSQVHALKDINMEIRKGSLTILRGRSGSGKTTLLNILSALDRPTDGQVLFCGQNITDLSENQRDDLRRKNIGFIFQSVALLPLMSAQENVDFAMRIAGYQGDRRKRAIDCLTYVGLKNRISHRPAELSGGEQQRVAIARAISHKPMLILADEPTAELDTHMALQVMRLFRDLIRDEQITILMTTHDPNMMELADTVYHLEDGAVVDVIHNQIRPQDDEEAET